MSPRLAFASLALLIATALVHCSSTDLHPKALGDDIDGGGVPKADATTSMPGNADTGADAIVDSGPPVDQAVPDTNPPPVVDAGPPNIVTSTKSIDYGMVGCGLSRPDVSFAVNNMGLAPFTWTGTLKNGGTSLFAITPATGTINPGQSQTVKLSMAKNVPFPGSTAADFYADVLTVVASGGSGSTSTDVAIHLTGKGAIPRFSPTSIDFGSVPLNTAPSSTFAIVNDGNSPAELVLAINNPRFSRLPLGPVVVAAGGTTSLAASFSATDSVAQVGTMTMAPSVNANDTFCADLPSAGLQMTGSGSNGTAGVSPASMSFGTAGRVNCGTQSASQPLAISNTGNASFTWTAALTSGASFYTVSPASGTVPAGQTQTVQVIPNPIPQNSAVTPELYSGTLSVSTSATNDSAHIVQLHQTAQGVILASTLGGQTLAFGGVAVGQTASSQFSVTNNGNVSTTVSFSNGSSVFSLSPSFAIASSQSVAPNVTFAPTATQPYTDTALMTVPNGTVLCGPMPANITLTGSGTNAVSVDKASLNFGFTSCGTTAAPQSLTLTNSGPTTNWIATLGLGVNSPYTVSPASGTLAVGSVTIVVTPKGVPRVSSTAADGFADTLTVKSDSPGDSPHVIALHETAQGAIMTFTPLSIASHDASPISRHVTFATFTVGNAGNLTAGYTLTITNPPAPYADTFTSNLAGGTMVGGSSAPGTLSIKSAPPSTQLLGTMHMAISAVVLCADPPPDMQLSAENP